MALPPRPRRHDPHGHRRARPSAWRPGAQRRLRPRRAASPSWRGRSCPRTRPRSSPPSTTPSPPAPRPRSSAGPSPTPPRCASPASTPRTTTATGTRCTTPSPPPTPCTRRSCAARRRSCCAAVYHGALRIYLDRFLNVPAARLPEPAPTGRPRPRRAPGVLGPGGPRRRGRRHRLPLPHGRRRPGAGRSPRSAGPCSTEDAEFHWFQTTRRPSASSTPGRPGPRRAP